MTNFFHALQRGAQSLADAARSMSLFPRIESPPENPLEASAKMIEEAWEEVGRALYSAMSEVGPLETKAQTKDSDGVKE